MLFAAWVALLLGDAALANREKSALILRNRIASSVLVNLVRQAAPAQGLLRSPDARAPTAPAELTPTAGPAEIRAYIEAHPTDPKTRRLRARHDLLLMPCPAVLGGGTQCMPEEPWLVAGVQRRAERYLRECLDCRYRDAVESLKVRVGGLMKRTETERAERRFEAALARRDFTDAAQTLADTAGRTQKAFAERARKRLAKTAGDEFVHDLESCRTIEPFHALLSPRVPRVGRPVRVLFVSETPVEAARAGIDGVESARAGGGPPWFWLAELPSPKAGLHRARVEQGGITLACRRFFVTDKPKAPEAGEALWSSTRGWDSVHENFYSAWIELLFEGREGQRWHGLHELTRDSSRNALFDHLGLAEDDARGLSMQPDCADHPYTLRAYFAWKLRLPFGHHRCGFGTLTGPPRCGDWSSNDAPVESADADGSVGPVKQFEQFLFRLKDEVYARSLRTELADEATDLYPVPLTRTALRPGTVFTDPYGHTLTLVRWFPQSREREGLLLAVDAQPDSSLRLKRFWRGNFLFPSAHPIGGHGFKAFRPIVLDAEQTRLLSNAEIAAADGYADFSLAQSRMSAADFYGRMARLINPEPLRPERELRLLLEALHAQLELRVTEVAAAEEILAERSGRVIVMPEGREIFRTTGAWEALSTPCRDLRLLVGMDAVLGYANEAAAQNRVLYGELERLRKRWSSELSISYRRSDGSATKLSVGELIARRANLEMAYNPNDCAELRWGAAEGTAELVTCKRRAPAEQLGKCSGFDIGSESAMRADSDPVTSPIERFSAPSGRGHVEFQPHFLPAPEATRLERALRAELDFEARAIELFGRRVLQPRLIAWAGDLPYRYSGQTLEIQALQPRARRASRTRRSAYGRALQSRARQPLPRRQRQHGVSLGRRARARTGSAGCVSVVRRDAALLARDRSERASGNASSTRSVTGACS